MNTNGNGQYSMASTSRGRARNVQAQQSRSVRGAYRTNSNGMQDGNINGSTHAVANASPNRMGKLAGINASCLYRSIYQSAVERGLLSDVSYKLYGASSDPPSEKQFVENVREAIALSVESREVFGTGGALTKLFQSTDPLGFFICRIVRQGGYSHLRCDIRLLMLIDATSHADPESREQYFISQLAILIRLSNFWPSNFEYTWIVSHLNVSARGSKGVQLNIMQPVAAKIAGLRPHGNSYITFNAPTGRVQGHQVPDMSLPLENLYEACERMYPQAYARTLFISHYGDASLAPSPGETYIRRISINPYDTQFVEPLFTFVHMPAQKPIEKDENTMLTENTMQSGGVRLKKVPKLKPKLRRRVIQHGGEDPCRPSESLRTLMRRVALVLWDSFAPDRRLRFKILLVGVAGLNAYSDCEDVLLEAMLSQGFRFEEIGIIDPESLYFGSAPGEVVNQSNHIKSMVIAHSAGSPPPTMSHYVMTLDDNFMQKAKRSHGSRPGQGYFDLCTYSSGERTRVMSVRGNNRAADLGLVIHACESLEEDVHTTQSEAYFYLPFNINERYRVTGPVGLSHWDYEMLMQYVVHAQELIFLGYPDLDDGSASVLGTPDNLKSRLPEHCGYYAPSFEGRRKNAQALVSSGERDRHLQAWARGPDFDSEVYTKMRAAQAAHIASGGLPSQNGTMRAMAKQAERRARNSGSRPF